MLPSAAAAKFQRPSGRSPPSKTATAIQSKPPALYRAVIFEVPGRPRGKGRARFVRATGHTYTPEETVAYESLIAAEAARAMAGGAPISGPVSLTITAVCPIPVSWSKVKRAAALEGRLRPTAKPDFDNVSKVVSDALNHVAWHDDAQIVDARFAKLFGDRPHLLVEVRPV